MFKFNPLHVNVRKGFETKVFVPVATERIASLTCAGIAVA